MNAALRKLIANYGDADRYPVSDTLVAYLREQTPDSLLHVVDDLFTRITLNISVIFNHLIKIFG